MTDTTTTVPVWDPKRSSIVDVPKNVADNLVRTGYHYKTGDDALREETDQGSVGVAGAVAHSYINGLGFGLPDVAAENFPSILGGDHVRNVMNRLHHQEDIHPNYAMAGDVASYFGPGGLLKVAGKGAEKVGMHALLKAAAEHTPQHLAEKLGTDIAAKHTLGEAATRLAGKAGSAVGFGVESGVRGAAKEDVEQQQKLDTPYDVEKVAQAFGYDGLVGGISDAAFGLAGEGLRAIRKGVTKTADILDRVYPQKKVRVGKEEIDPEEIRTTTYRRKRTVTEKTETRSKTGGGYKEESSADKTRTKEAHSEDTSRSSQATNKGTKSTDQTTKTGNNETINEDIYADPDAPDGAPKRETGIEWSRDDTEDDILGSIKKRMDEVVAKDPDHKAMDVERRRLEALIKEHGTNGQYAQRLKAIDEKKEYTDYLRENVPDFAVWQDEYSNVKNGHYKVFNPTSVEDPLKVGKKTTKESFNQSTRTKTGEVTTDTGKESSRVKSSTSSDTTNETKTKSRVNEDLNEEKRTTTSQTHEYEPVEKVRHKRRYNPLYETRRSPYIPWQIKGGGGYVAHAAGLGPVVAPLFAGDIAIPHVLNNRSMYSKWLDKATLGPAELMGKLTRNLTTSYLDDRNNHVQANLSKALRHPDNLYQQVTSSLQAHANDPAATQQAIQHNWQHALVEHPQLQVGLMAHTQNIAKVAQSHIPPDNRPPTAQHTPYNPPRSQKVKFLRLFHAMNQPLAAMENPTPQMMQVIEQTNPETLNMMRRNLAGHIAENGKPFTGKAAQVVSMILGEPVNPRNVSAYLKRLQDTASLDNPPSEPSGGNMAGPHAGSIAGPKSAKVQQDAANLYATPQQLQQLA